MASKRRVQLYTLPIIVGVAFLLVAGLAAWRRADLVATLSDQIAHGEKSEAPVAVSQLGAISNPPLSILVEAAACDQPATVEAAQIAINKLLDEWQQQVDNHERLSRVADQVSQLSAALAEQRRTFPTTSYPWLASVTHKLVRIADKCPPKTMPLLALHCDEIMTQVASASYAPTIIAPISPAPVTVRQSNAPISSPANSQEMERRQLEQTFTAFPTSSAELGSKPFQSSRLSENVADEDGRLRNSDNPLRHESIPQGQAGSSLGPDTGDDTTPGINQSANDSVDDAMHGNRLRPTSEEPHATSTASDFHQPSSASGTYSTRELFERWRTASGDEHRDIESQLAARGFKHLSPALVQQYLSTGDNRSRIVDTVLKLPGAEVRPWLFLLADDEDADVRLMAVTVMATSADRALIEKAWQISIRDEDPRIADLSAHLRERRAGTQLR